MIRSRSIRPPFVSGANLTVNLNDDGPTPGSDGLTLAGGSSVATTGTGAIFLDVSRYISVPSGVSLRSASGDITLRANQQGHSYGCRFGRRVDWWF